MASANGQDFFLCNNPSSHIIQNKYHVSQHCVDLDDVLIRCFSNKDYNFVTNIVFQMQSSDHQGSSKSYGIAMFLMEKWCSFLVSPFTTQDDFICNIL
jgi:hypothetical protein